MFKYDSMWIVDVVYEEKKFPKKVFYNVVFVTF